MLTHCRLSYWFGLGKNQGVVAVADPIKATTPQAIGELHDLGDLLGRDRSSRLVAKLREASV